MSTVLYGRRHNLLGFCRNCTKVLAEGSKIYCEYHREKNHIYSRKKSKKEIIKNRNDCLRAYGNKCICCGEKREEFLTIDHIGGNGNEHRRSLFNIM